MNNLAHTLRALGLALVAFPLLWVFLVLFMHDLIKGRGK